MNLKTMYTKPVILGILSFSLVGCMEAMPVRPVLTCADCNGLTYYGPQQPDPRVEMAKVITGGVSSVAGIFVGGDVLKTAFNGSNAASSTIERTNNNTTNNTTDTSSLVDRSVSESVSVSNTSNTSVSDTSSNTSSTSSFTGQ